MSIWEFSGYEPYYGVYDHFVGDPNCIHVVVFRACDRPDVQLKQLQFWLDFLRIRIAPAEPIGLYRECCSFITDYVFCCFSTKGDNFLTLLRAATPLTISVSTFREEVVVLIVISSAILQTNETIFVCSN